MKLVVGMPIKERAWALPSWFEAMESQGIDYELITLYSPSSDDTEEILKAHGASIIYDESGMGRPMHEIDSHAWGNPSTYWYMAQMRNMLLETAIDMGADYFFSLDSDIVMPPGGLKSLLRFAETHTGVFAPAVNMTIGQTVWNTMNWVDKGFPNIANRELTLMEERQVDVVMAAMLLDQYGMACRWSSTGQGEDVGFCIDAAKKHIRCWWLPEIRARHMMRRY